MATPASREKVSGTISPKTHHPESFPYGQRAKGMLAALKRAEWLPDYDEEGVRAVNEECNRLMEMSKDIMNSGMDHEDPSIAVTLTIFHESICRNKRSILAYLGYRLEKIEELWWKTASPVIEPELAKRLSKGEIEYYAQYQELVSKTMDTVDLNLTAHLQPPHDLFVEVRVLQDAGEVLLDSGARVVFERNSTHYLRRSDVEHLIRQNVLEQVQ